MKVIWEWSNAERQRSELGDRADKLLRWEAADPAEAIRMVCEQAEWARDDDMLRRARLARMILSN